MPSPRLLCPLLALSLLACATTEDPVLARRLKGMRAARDVQESDLQDAKLELQLAGGGKSWCPGASKPAQIRAIVHTKDADLYTPVKSKHEMLGYLPQSTIDLSIKGGTLGPEWILQPPATPQDLLSVASKPVVVTGKLRKATGAPSTLAIETSFECDQLLEFPGRDGRDGVSGEDGEDGLDVAVALAYVSIGGKKLVLAKATPSSGGVRYVLLAPGRRLTVDVHGGKGGNGGEGVDWRVRVIGMTSGDGGDGGRVVVQFDSAAPELRNLVNVVNPGGKEGASGSTHVGDSPVGPGRAGRAGPAAKYQAGAPSALFAEEIQEGVPVLGATSKSEI